MTNHNIKLPSQQKTEREFWEEYSEFPFSMTEIEGRSLSRVSRAKKQDNFWSYIFAGFIFMLFLTALYVLMGNYVDRATQPALIQQAQAAEVGTVESFCLTAKTDHAMSATDLSENLKELCSK